MFTQYHSTALNHQDAFRLLHIVAQPKQLQLWSMVAPWSCKVCSVARDSNQATAHQTMLSAACVVCWLGLQPIQQSLMFSGLGKAGAPPCDAK